MVDSGRLTSEEAAASRWSHVLWNCLGGGSSELSPEVYKSTLSLGDTLLLCSDGLTTCLHHNEIQKILEQNRTAEETCHLLVEAKDQGGGPDNTTVVVARFTELNEQEAKAEADASAPQHAGHRAESLIGNAGLSGAGRNGDTMTEQEFFMVLFAFGRVGLDRRRPLTG